MRGRLQPKRGNTGPTTRHKTRQMTTPGAGCQRPVFSVGTQRTPSSPPQLAFSPLIPSSDVDPTSSGRFTLSFHFLLSLLSSRCRRRRKRIPCNEATKVSKAASKPRRIFMTSAISLSQSLKALIPTLSFAVTHALLTHTHTHTHTHTPLFVLTQGKV